MSATDTEVGLIDGITIIRHADKGSGRWFSLYRDRTSAWLWYNSERKTWAVQPGTQGDLLALLPDTEFGERYIDLIPVRLSHSSSVMIMMFCVDA